MSRAVLTPKIKHRAWHDAAHDLLIISKFDHFQATSEWQSVVVKVAQPKLPTTQPQVSLRQDCCTWWIKGNGKRVEIQLESVTPGSAGGCRNDCTFGGTEVKFGDLTRGGARVCCAEHAKEFGTVTTSTEMAIIRVCSMRTSYTTTVKFRTTG